MWDKFIKYFGLLIVKGSVVLIFWVGLGFVVVVLYNFKNDTTPITNVAFGITAVLASLCFSCSRALKTEDEDRDRFTYAGERFMHASILLITASILKYALLVIQGTAFGQTHMTIIPLVTAPLGLCVPFVFMQALLSAHTGLRVCGNLLWPRLNRYDDFNKLV
jgi:predicted membrane channel-forming protein YqfA (hemolysin III family)